MKRTGSAFTPHLLQPDAGVVSEPPGPVDGEDRFRSLLQLSSDWYWEQDDNYRFTPNLRGFSEKPGIRPADYVGKTRWEMACHGVSDAQWAEHKALLRARRPFYNFEYLRPSSDGVFRWVSISGEPVFDAQGRFKGYRGIGQDITERKQAQQRQVVQHAVARILSESDSLCEAIPGIIRAVCETMGWDYGARWELIEEDQTFRVAEMWCRPHLEHSEFVTFTRSRRFSPGPHGLVRRVLSTKEPYWVMEIDQELNLTRGRAALNSGLTGAFALPLMMGNQLLGAMEFFAHRIWQPDLAITETARSVGRQVGQFMVRKQVEERYRELVELSPDGILIYCDGRIVFANGAAMRLLGVGQVEGLIGRPMLDVVHPDYRALLDARVERAPEGSPVLPRVEMKYLRVDGAAVDVEVSSSYFVHDGRPAVQVMARDVSERKSAEQKIIRLSHLYAALSQTNRAITRIDDPRALLAEVCRVAVEHGRFDTAAIVMVDETTQWTEMAAIAGARQAYLLSARISMNPDLPDGQRLTAIALRNGTHIVCNDFAADPRVARWRDELLEQGLRSSAHVPLRSHGRMVGALVLLSPEPGCFDAQLVELLLEMASNISFALDAFDKEAQRRQAEERLALLAQYDVLTGLPNRNLFRDRLVQAMARARRTGGLVGLMFFDLDRFKQINDSLGHATGDRVLKIVAERLKEHLREADTLSRLGGDEFTLIVEGAADTLQLVAVADKVRAALAAPVEVDGREMFVTTSIGITVFPRDADDADDLLKNADIAMYRAKHEGRNTSLFYTPEMAVRAADRMYLEGGLRQALERGEFLLHFQPIVQAASGRIVGAEALVRWSSLSGMVPPADFIPVAEETGLIVEIGRRVLEAACAQVVDWQSKGFAPVLLRVNLSPRQVLHKGMYDVIATALSHAGLDPTQLTLEITESMLMQQAEDVIDKLMQLDTLGVRLAVDDFGTGYSSLAYLKRFPVHELKVDQSFVRDVTLDPDTAAIVRAIMAMARTLGIDVTAEGVETSAQLELLRGLGCGVYQGYLFSPPLPAPEFEALLRSQVGMSPH
jgi:diguanylate cyclase (GGDEF)-like protein/PAS domain S-box-containing protein